jgi:prophage regulatory protein
MRLLSMPELRSEKGVSYSRPHLFRLIKTGAFPRPIKLGENRNAWLEAEVDAWIEARVALSRPWLGPNMGARQQGAA